MEFLRRLSFALWYYRRPPWDSGILPPEVGEFIAAHPAGRALDLGCGTGTSSIALAQSGWSVTGVDFIARAVKKARLRAAAAKVSVDFRIADVARLPAFPQPFDLVLDVGCFHGLPPSAKSLYLDRLEALLAPHGTWLMYGFFKPDEKAGPGLTSTDLGQAIRHLTLEKRIDGSDKRGRPSAWFWFRTAGR